MANTYTRLGALRPANTNEAKLYGPVTGKSAIVSVVICNQDTVDQTYKLALTNTDATADTEDWIAYDYNIGANSSNDFTGICLTYPQTLRVQSSAADKISFVAYGLEIS
jgi:hypothetical protein